MGLENRVLLILLATATPITAMLVVTLLVGDFSALYWLTIVPLAVLSVLAGVGYMRHHLQRQFFGIANVLECLRNGDFSLRSSTQNKDSAWGEINHELNLLASHLQESRLHSLESEIILDKLVEQFDVPMFVIERGGALKHINQAGLVLYGTARNKLIGLSANQLNLLPLLSLPPGELTEHQFPMRAGQWEIRSNVIRQQGGRMTLLMVNDLSRALREQERLAWQKLIRVLGHELNNSIASMTSVAETLAHHPLIKGETALQKGAAVIVERGHALQRFSDTYTRLSKVPEPAINPTPLRKVIEHIKTLFDGLEIQGNLDLVVDIDSDLIEQVMLNLVKNGLESGAAKPHVVIKIIPFATSLAIDIIDNGQGISNPDNLFVPFYTTKSGGSGIGLFLSRQIIEAHHGQLSLSNRVDENGCVARIWLPN